MTAITGTNVTIMVKDMDAAINFYLSLGLALQQRWENYYAMMTTTGLTIGIHPKEEGSATSSGTVSIGFMVEKIEDAKALLDKNKITCKHEGDGDSSGLYLYFTDLDGTILYFVQPKW